MRLDLLPTTDDRDTQRDILIGDAMGTHIADALADEQLGVMIETPPQFDPTSMVTTLDEDCSYTIGMALVNIDEADIDALQTDCAATDIRVTDDLSVAVQWRNGTATDFTWDGETVPDRIVVFVRGDPPKLGSLHRLTSVPLGHIRRQICELMTVRPEFADNTPSQALWEALQADIGANLAIPPLAAYAVSCLKSTNQASINALGENLYVLGLFTDSRLLQDHEAVANRLETNAALLNRTLHITNRDRKRLINSIKRADTIDEEPDDGVGDLDQAEFIDRLRRFQRTNQTDLLADLEFERVRDAFETTSQSQSLASSDEKTGDDDGTGDESAGTSTESQSGESRYDTRTDDARVSTELVFDDQTEALTTLADDIDDELNSAIDENETSAEFTYQSDQKLKIDVESDLSHFLKRFISTDRYGGVIRGGASRNEVLTDFPTLETEYFTVDDDDGSFQKLRSFADRNDEFRSVVDAFDKYCAAREALVDAIPALVHTPLVRLLGDSELLTAARDYLEQYRVVQDKLDKKYRALQDASPRGSRRLLSDFLLLDTLVMETDRGRELMLSPVHPLHLWKYVRLATAVVERDDSLSEDNKEFLAETVEEQPHVLSNLTIGGGRLIEEETYLIQSDEEGNLPVYTEPDRAEPGDNEDLWDYLIEKFTTAYPPSKRHLKITVVDPISPHQLLTSITDAVDEGRLQGATVEYAYIEGDEKNLLDAATSDEEEAIINLFGPERDTDGFDIRTIECPDYDVLVDHLDTQPRHFVVLNDQSSFYVEEFERDMDTAINPLYVPKEYDYDKFEATLSIRPSTEGPLFSEYQNLVTQLQNQRTGLHNAGVHELDVSRETVQRLQSEAIWVCLSTPAMNSDPFWEQDLISKERRGDRDYAVYSGDIDLFARTLRRILNEYPLAPQDADIEAIAQRIADTERSGLLRLLTEETFGDQQSRNSKGLLGSIIAVQWVEETYEDPKLIFSIDDPRTRRWLNFGDSNRRADFIVLQPDDNGGLEMEIIEIKSLDEPDLAFQVGTEDGATTITGDAVDQLTETVTTIQSLFAVDDGNDVTTAPRREVLREQLYYELAGQDVPGNKNDWVERINTAFGEPNQMRVDARIASVEINNQAASVTTDQDETERRFGLQATRLPNQTVVRLLVNGTDDYPDKETGATDDESTETGQDTGQTEADSSQETHDAEESPESALANDQEDSQDSDTEPEDVPDEPASTTGADSEVATDSFGDPDDYADEVESLKRVLHEFNIDIDKIDPSAVEVGPNLIRYKIELAGGQKQGPLENRAEDIAREMALEQEPYIHRLPGTQYVAIDVPRAETQPVHIEDYLSALPDREDLTLSELPFIAGIKPVGDPHLASLDDAPHMLVGGTTGSGKTVFLYSLLAGFLETFDPDELRLAIIDPKLTNFMFFNQLPNLEHDQVITDSQDTAELFDWIINEEVPRRTQELGASGSIDIEEHNERSDEPLRPLVVVIDEYADLIDDLGNESDAFEENVRRIAQKARSVGIHLVISTQRPSAQIIDTDLRANLDMRVALRLPSSSDSQVILDESGAEGLAGNGDMLFKEAESVTRDPTSGHFCRH
jgi:hypothetical protein